jgi:hypothetical protein
LLTGSSKSSWLTELISLLLGFLLPMPQHIPHFFTSDRTARISPMQYNSAGN